MKTFRGILVAVATAALLMFVWAPWACGQGVPPSLDTGGWRASPPANNLVCDPSNRNCNPNNPNCGPEGCEPKAPAGVNPAVCRIKNVIGQEVVTGSGEFMSYGSGTLIETANGRGLVVTCAHIFREGQGKVSCLFPDGKEYAASVVGDKTGADLTAMLIADPGITPIQVGMANPPVRAMVTAAGYGPDGRYLKQSGLVMEVNQKELIMTGSARDGDSGGPILNAQGELVGILWGTNGREIRATSYPATDDFLQRAGRYLLPWNAQINDPARDPRNQPPQVIIQPPQQQPYPLPSGPDPGLLGRMSQAESRITSLEGVAEAAKAAAANATTEAGKAFAEAVGAKAAVAEEVEKATPGLIETAKEGLKEKLGGVLTIVPWLKYGGIGLGVGFLYLLLKTSGKRVSEGGKSWGERLTDATPWEWDDKYGRGWSKGIGMGYGFMHPQAAAAAAAAAQQQQAQAPLSPTAEQAVAMARAAGYVVSPPPIPPG